jgi:tRNA pseudouridine55 synthase
MDRTKEYVFRVRWGESRATDDAEGEVTGRSEKRPEAGEIRAVLRRFTGEIAQVPPAFSAIKLQGRRAYALARKGETPELAPRTVQVEALELLDTVGAESADFRVRCGKGTYVRSLARDIAVALGTLGYVEYLRRTATGGFGEKHAISLEKLETFRHSAAAFEHLLPVETALDDILALAVTGDEADRVKCGQSLTVPDITTTAGRDALSEGRTLRLMCGDRLIAIAEIREGQVRPVRVMNY